MIILEATVGSKYIKLEGKLPKILPMRKMGKNSTFSTSGRYNETFITVIRSFTITVEKISEQGYKDLQYLFMRGIEFIITDSNTGGVSAEYFTFDADTLELTATYNKEDNTTIYSGAFSVIGTEGG